MKKRTIIISAIVIVAVVLTVVLTRDSEMTCGKYTKPGFGSDAVINIKEDGTFTYSPGMLSSYFQMGNWKLKGKELTMFNEFGDFWYFRVEDKTLEFIKGESEQGANTVFEAGETFTLKN